MVEPAIAERVRVLVENLASGWTGGRRVLQRLVENVDDGAGPYEAYRRLGPHGLARVFGTEDARQELSDAFQGLAQYLAAETWFDDACRDDWRLEQLRRHPVAYFCTEFGLEDWLPIYSGGLGVLAGDVLKEASDMGLPLVGIGLFYRHGFFSQSLDGTGYQTETYPTLDPENLPLSAVSDPDGATLLVEIPLEGRIVRARAWRLQVGRTDLYLLDTDIPENERTSDRAITAHLYGGDVEVRIQQELVLGIGGVRLLRALGIEPSIYGMNEGHAAFLGVELLLEALESMDFSSARRQVRTRVAYTNHTVVPAGNDIFPRELVQRYLGPLLQQRSLRDQDLLELATGEAGSFSMAVLAFQLAGKANAVSQLHAQVIPRQWPGFAVEAITNGVHIPSWLGPEMRALLDKYLPNWWSDSPNWDAVHDIPAQELWNAHTNQRAKMLRSLGEHGAALDPNALTLVWARRFAEYKRAGLITHDLPRLARLLSNRSQPIQFIISGKAHPKDEAAKRMMQALLREAGDDAAIAPHVIFVPDYGIDIARSLIMGADIWLNTPRKLLEASGTSGMKASDNGCLQLTVRDGWAAEVDWWDVGWGIEGRDDATDAEQLYDFLEESIIPTFYDRDAADTPQKWVTMMKNTMLITLSRYSTRRMLLEYIDKLYLPLVEQQEVMGGVGV